MDHPGDDWIQESIPEPSCLRSQIVVLGRNKRHSQMVGWWVGIRAQVPDDLAPTLVPSLVQNKTIYQDHPMGRSTRALPALCSYPTRS